MHFQREPRGSAYVELLAFLERNCASFSLVWRDAASAPHSKIALQPFLVGESESDCWPGTQLIGHAATVRHYTASPEAVALLRRVDGLYEWQEPALPEDLAFYDAGGSVVLGSIAHEGDGWLALGAFGEVAAARLLRVLRASGVIAP